MKRVRVSADVALQTLVAALFMVLLLSAVAVAGPVVPKVDVRASADPAPHKKLIVHSIRISGLAHDNPLVRCNGCKRKPTKVKVTLTAHTKTFSNMSWILDRKHWILITVSRKGYIGRFVKLGPNKAGHLVFLKTGCVAGKKQIKCPAGTTSPAPQQPVEPTPDQPMTPTPTAPNPPPDNTPKGPTYQTTATNQDLAVVKYIGTGAARVQYDTRVSGYQQAGGDWATTYAAGPDPGNKWQLIDMDGDGKPDLVLIVWNQTGTGTVEVHWSSAASGYTARNLDVGSPFNQADGLNGPWQMADMDKDGKNDLVFIKVKNPGSGRVELHDATGASTYQSRGLGIASVFTPNDTSLWQLADLDSDGTPDLVKLDTTSTASGKVELHYSSAASNFGARSGDWTSGLATAQALYQFADMDNDGRPDLVQIQTSNTLSGLVEVNYASAASGFQQVFGPWKSLFAADGVPNAYQMTRFP